MKKPQDLRLKLLICLVLGLVTLAAFWQVRDFQFLNRDDNRYITENVRVQTGLTWENAGWAFTSTYASNWHPLTWLSHMADRQLWGPGPRGPHLVNLGFHLLNVLLLFLVLARLTGAVWPSALTAALFAWHPLHVESVAWVAERKDVLSSCCWLLTLGAYGYYAARPGLGRYLWVLALYALALLAKPMTVTLPFVLLLLDYWPLGRLSFPPRAGKQSIAAGTPYLRLLLEKLPLVIMAGAVSLLTLLAQTKAISTSALLPLGARLANALVVYVKYLVKMVWPYPLAGFYPHPLLGAHASLPWWQPAGAALLLAGITYLTFREARRRPYLVVGWLWYLVTLLPVIGLVQAGAQEMADRYTYLPLIGVFIMVSWGAAAWAARGRRPQKLVGLGAAAVLLALLPVTWVQVGHWRDDRELFGHMLQVTRNNFIAYGGMSKCLKDQGDLNGAEEMALKALEVNPDYKEVYDLLGNIYGQQGNLDRAIEMYRNSLEFDDRRPVTYNNLGAAYLLKGEVDRGLEMFQKALRLNPRYDRAYLNLGNAYALKGDLAQAAEMYRKALEINPGYAKARRSLRKLRDLGYD